EKGAEKKAPEKARPAEKAAVKPPEKSAARASQTVPVPDIGDFKEVEVIEVLVKPGDSVAKEQSLVTLESDKATMEIPAPMAGLVKEIKVKVGDKVSKGSAILVLDSSEKPSSVETPKGPTPPASPSPVNRGAAPSIPADVPPAPSARSPARAETQESGAKAHAS